MLRKLVVALAMVGLLTTSALAGPYAGVQIGPSFPSGTDTTFNGNSITDPTFYPGFAIGGQVGFDFNDGRHTFPAWAQYFSVALDYQFNTLNLSNYNGLIDRNGNQHALSLLGIVKYPMMKTADFPRGRLFPYVGAGPTLVWTSLAGMNSTDVGVVVEPGVRYMFTPRISGDLAYRFRYMPVSSNGVKSNNMNHFVMLRASYHF